jgi:DNA polymerase-3 subunit gamma/tau
LDELARGGKDLGRLLGDLLNHFRNLLIYQISKGDLNLLEASEAEVAALKEQSGLATTDAFTRVLEVLADAELRLRDAASKKILIEVTLLRAIEARNALSLDAVLKQLNQLRSEGGASVAPVMAAAPAKAAPAPAMSPRAAVAVAPAAKPVALETASVPVTAPPAAAGNLSDLWLRLVDAVGRASTFTRSYLLNAHPVSFEKNVLVIGFDPEFEDYLGLVDNSRNHTLLTTKLAELGHHSAMIKFIKSEAPIGWQRPTAPPASTPAPAIVKPAPPAASKTSETTAAPIAEKKTAPVAFNKDEFKNDPLIKKALEVFKGTIVEVRA